MDAKHEILTDREIVDNLANDRDLDRTIRYLYRAYFEFTGHYVVNNSGSWTDAEDIFQEVVVAFIHLVKAGKFRGEASIKTFLYALNKNSWLNELKKRGRALKRETKYEAARPGEEESINSLLEGREATQGLMKVFDDLGETCKKILLLFYFENRSMKEILNDLHYENEQVVRNKKHKCLKKLEQMIQTNKNLYQQLKSYLHG
jgi:RNA polymerase sigma factor (sigma-70 family)